MATVTFILQIKELVKITNFTFYCSTCYCAVPQNIHTSPKEGFLFCTLPPLPGNSSLFSYIASKNLAFKTPHPRGISNDLPWGGYVFLLELHIVRCTHLQHSVFQITFKGRVSTSSFDGFNRCRSIHAFSSFSSILSGQVASFLGFLS